MKPEILRYTDMILNPHAMVLAIAFFVMGGISAVLVAFVIFAILENRRSR